MNRPPEGATPFQAVERELFRMIRDALSPAPGPEADGPDRPEDEPPFAPPVDLFETAEETLVLVDLPGVDPASVEITADGGVLTIRGTRPADGPPAPARRVGERRFGPFARRVPLTREVDLDAARAEARDGVLTVRLPRPAARRPRTIPIRPG